MRTGVIYCITNQINGKKYVGQTIVPLRKRMSRHKYAESAIGNAIRKYGFDNFKVEVLHEARQEVLGDIEKECILNHDSMYPNGYNLTLDCSNYRTFCDHSLKKKGKHTLGKKQSKELIEKRMSKIRKPVTCIEDQITFLSMNYAAEHYGIVSVKSIRRQIKGIRKSKIKGKTFVKAGGASSHSYQ
jgi:hypothetical protein